MLSGDFERLRQGRVASSPQRPPHHLLAQKLCTEGTNPQDVGDRVRVPPFGEHRDADDTLDLLAEFARLPDGVHHLPEQILISQVRRVPAGEAISVLLLELLDLTRRDRLEVATQ